MLKFLRKYNKFILVVGGSLLMVAFLLQGTLTQCQSDPRNITYAKLGDRTISLHEYNRAAAEVRALERIVPVATAFLDQGRKVDHWLLLTHEASRAGVVGDDADGANWIPEVAREMARASVLQQYSQFPPELLQRLLGMPQIRQQIEQQAPQIEGAIVQRRAQVAAAEGLPVEAFDRALAKARGINRLVEAYRRAASVSDVRARQYADRQRDTAYVDAAFVPASAVIDRVEELSEDELRSHFERFKGTPPGGGDYGIGYLLPPRVRLEWMVLDRDALARDLELDPIEVRKHYTRRRDEFPGEFEAERGRVERALRERIVDDILVEAGNAVQARVQEATASLETDGRFKVLPEGWDERMPRMEEIAQHVVERVKETLVEVPVRDADEGVNIPLPEVNVRDADWLTREDLQQLEGLSRAQYRSGTIRIPFPDAVLRVRELGGRLPVPFQVGVPLSSASFEDNQGNRYYVTVLDAREESPPDTFEEVADQVREDARTLAAYELLARRAEELRTLAVDEGLDAIVEHFRPQIATIEREPTEIPNRPEHDEAAGDGAQPEDADTTGEPAPADAVEEPEDGEHSEPESPVELWERVRVSRNGIEPSAPPLNREAFREGVLEASRQLDPLIPVAEQPLDLRTVAEPLSRSLGLAIAQIIGVRPTTSQQLWTGIENDVRAFAAGEFADAAEARGGEFQGPFAYDALRQRLDYQPVRRRGPVEPPAAADEPSESGESEGDAAPESDTGSGA